MVFRVWDAPPLAIVSNLSKTHTVNKGGNPMLTTRFLMSDKQILLLLFYMTLSTWLEYKSVKSRDTDAQVGWGAVNWIVLCLYTSQFAKVLKTIDFLKDLDEGLVLIIGFLTLCLYEVIIRRIVKSI